MFCWNCVFVNISYTIFLLVRVMALDWWFPETLQCFYDKHHKPAVNYTIPDAVGEKAQLIF